MCCREAIRACGLAIRSVHRLDPESTAERLADAERAIRRAQQVLSPHSALAAAGFLHDAEKEYAEAHLTSALIGGGRVPASQDLGVSVAAWLNGLAEAASELRRHLLDRLRAGEVTRAEGLLEAMEEVYDLLVTVEYPDALTGGLRRSTDALRAVLERSRSDVTATVVQRSLLASFEERLGRSASSAIL